MEKFPLPLKDFQIDTNTQLSEILATSNESSVGYILEVDINYPDMLHNLHKDFPLAPTKEAAWHFKFDPSLHENVTRRMRTSPETYNTSNELVHQPLGEYEMPMEFNRIPRFKKANKVQVNVFQYRQKI